MKGVSQFPLQWEQILCRKTVVELEMNAFRRHFVTAMSLHLSLAVVNPANILSVSYSIDSYCETCFPNNVLAP